MFSFNQCDDFNYCNDIIKSFETNCVELAHIFDLLKKIKLFNQRLAGILFCISKMLQDTKVNYNTNTKINIESEIKNLQIQILNHHLIIEKTYKMIIPCKKFLKDIRNYFDLWYIDFCSGEYRYTLREKLTLQKIYNLNSAVNNTDKLKHYLNCIIINYSQNLDKLSDLRWIIEKSISNMFTEVKYNETNLGMLLYHTVKYRKCRIFYRYKALDIINNNINIPPSIHQKLVDKVNKLTNEKEIDNFLNINEIVFFLEYRIRENLDLFMHYKIKNLLQSVWKQFQTYEKSNMYVKNIDHFS